MTSMFSKLFGRNKDIPKQKPTEPIRQSFSGPDINRDLNKIEPEKRQYFQEEYQQIYRPITNKNMTLKPQIPNYDLTVAPQHKINVSSSQQKIYKDKENIKDLIKKILELNKNIIKFVMYIYIIL